MHITPDFTEAVENGPVPPGVYKARITDCEKKVSKKGDDYLNWKLSIFGAEGDLSSQNNRVVFMMTMLKGPGAGRLKDLAKAAFGTMPSDWNTDNFLGKEVEITLIEKRDMNGNVSNFPDVRAVRALR